MATVQEIKTYKGSKDGIAPPELRNIHPLGKSSVVTILSASQQQQPPVLAETGAIVEYLTERWGQQLIPKRNSIEAPGEAYLRSRYFMHYAEGSLMGLLAIAAVMLNIKNAPIPFFVKPITKAITSKIGDAFLDPNFSTHFDFLQGKLKTALGSSGYLCGEQLLQADIMIVFPLQAARAWAGLSKTRNPLLCAYLERMTQRESYKGADTIIVEAHGSFKPIP